MWTEETRRRHDRSGLRYNHDLTDEEWAEVAPLIPPAKPGGNKRTVDIREVLNGVMYITGSGCQWPAPAKAGGVTSRRTCRRAARSMTISIAGSMMGHWNGSIMHCT